MRVGENEHFLSGSHQDTSSRAPISAWQTDSFCARATALCAPHGVERSGSDQIAGTGATRGPRRLKGLVAGLVAGTLGK